MSKPAARRRTTIAGAAVAAAALVVLVLPAGRYPVVGVRRTRSAHPMKQVQRQVADEALVGGVGEMPEAGLELRQRHRRHLS
jgi:hypothetical protein